MFGMSPYEKAVMNVKNKQVFVDKTLASIVNLTKQSEDSQKLVEPVEPVKNIHKEAIAVDDAADAAVTKALAAFNDAAKVVVKTNAARKLTDAPASATTDFNNAITLRNKATATLKAARDFAAIKDKERIFAYGRLAAVIANNSDAIADLNKVTSMQALYNKAVIDLDKAKKTLSVLPIKFTNSDKSCDWLYYVIAALVCIALIALITYFVRKGKKGPTNNRGTYRAQAFYNKK